MLQDAEIGLEFTGDLFKPLKIVEKIETLIILSCFILNNLARVRTLRDPWRDFDGGRAKPQLPRPTPNCIFVRASSAAKSESDPHCL